MVGGVEDELANSLLPSSLFPSSCRTIGAGSARRCYGETAKTPTPPLSQKPVYPGQGGFSVWKRQDNLCDCPVTILSVQTE
jgi:hypothetical protein